MLNTLLSDEVQVDEKIEFLQTEFGTSATKRFKVEMETMCNLNSGIEQKGMEKEIKKGIAQARKTSQWAWNHMINATEDQVREETREEEQAIAEAEKIINARKMIKDNFTVEMIERYTGLSVEKITDLLSQR